MTDLEQRLDSAPAVREAVENATDEIKRREMVIHAARKARLGTATINEAVGGKVRAMFRLADVVDQGQAGGWIATRENRKIDASSNSEDVMTLDDLGIEPPRLSEARTLRARYAKTLDQIIDDATDQDKPLSYSGLLTRNSQAAKDLVESNENEWYTPAPYLDAARRVLEAFDLDPASSEAANEIVQAAEYYDQDDDGLTLDWHGRVWLNPPYGRLSGDFIARLVDQYNADNVEAAVALVNAHSTDARWFQRLWDYTLCFTDHRIDFESAGREKTSTSTHGSVFAYLGPYPEKFAAEFAQFGAIVRRWP